MRKFLSSTAGASFNQELPAQTVCVRKDCVDKKHQPSYSSHQPSSDCKTEVFGTAVTGSFKEKMETLLRSLNIRGHFKDLEGSTGHQKDGNLDIVTWIPFSDKKDGQMIALGQCKTDTYWESMLTELDPDSFFSLYSSQQPYAKPLKMFFVAESFGKYKWGERSSSGGVLFDRTRIMEFLPDEVDGEMGELLSKIIIWNKAALATEATKEDVL